MESPARPDARNEHALSARRRDPEKGRVIKDVVIFNAEEGHSPEAFDPADIADIRLSSR